MTQLKEMRSKVELLGIVLALVGFAVYVSFGVNYRLLNAGIVALMLLSVCACAAAIVLKNNWLTIIAEVLLTIAFMFIIRDGIATFVDWYNGTAMFGGTGRMDLVVTILYFTLGAIIAEIVSCFMKDK